ncbi:Spore cortex protein YabQ (Spore_YabQ) [Desulfosporosinus orientis DSM 765]|uniref:Spore cortex protein YabQ (Spore_YabQ) n=1 Tax=Desulfosporosinus orientis (strain ATCC 19365 / DSM 765 / NCIMB 8382 / VKM B-1628 / Singapore I) TaxID=768706 RepID=G7W7F6_DESOD|nr:Spore cortex protein YabQ (Spore_YabQ) [Desulfosporosinus orientis DSM 765]
MAGVSVGLVFDVYRSFRRWREWGQLLTFIGDVLFSLFAMVILFYYFQKANALDFRFYIIWGSLLGLGLYLRIFSKHSLRFFFGFYRFLSFLAQLIHRGIKIPIRVLKFLMRPPYAMLQWFSLLFYRIGEFILVEPMKRVRKRISEWWKGLLPPRING